MLRSLVFILAVLVSITGCQQPSDPSGASEEVVLPPAANAKPVEASKKLLRLYLVGTHIKDEEAGGFAPCDNLPEDLNGKSWGTKGAIAIVAFPAEPVMFFEHRGFTVRVINRTADPVPFKAFDSSLDMMREAKDAEGTWREIESLPSAICGNSYHRVTLGPDQYWLIPACEYTGPIKTKMRLRLKIGKDQPAIYSNEFDGLVTAAQLAGR
jgi:hypothetical protein